MQSLRAHCHKRKLVQHVQNRWASNLQVAEEESPPYRAMHVQRHAISGCFALGQQGITWKIAREEWKDLRNRRADLDDLHAIATSNPDLQRPRESWAQICLVVGKQTQQLYLFLARVRPCLWWCSLLTSPMYKQHLKHHVDSLGSRVQDNEMSSNVHRRFQAGGGRCRHGES